ncbi:insulin-like growth factor-binding protein 3 receptor isoform X1 [Bombina bombina]|uniref:insulin-like growth factor-binding protein 3 receptor isoform X1 n=1 Tax=Bombina bombina TaxID=8345 RepID=UPI00235A9645|nr:insulin-like growth factor-binding protein 3 receptor isoform X1 [Bombina bombina]XP_053551048.1 insulin-like growth factor-binding protein 3 receptor isoform X1 [Bombina bombina]XP_053551049.1 insulin-like growth factor-binding protein 3 receptor isoform X1 [Bombina bombina]XP_053551050.1 insulin-like growth factor-binding protein 3 receptor isoform X1 [Bombina bombina]
MVLFRGLRACIHQYPPLVMFFLCIATLVISFLCLGVYVKTHTVRDADVAQDWDSFILALSMLHFCPKGNMTGNLSNVSELSTVGFRKKSVVAVLGLHPWDSASSSTSLRLAVKGIQLGLKGDREDANMVVTVSRFIETEKCNASDQACITRFCITVFGPESSLPNTRLLSQCSESAPSAVSLPDLYVAKQKPDSPSRCYRVRYSPDPTLQTMVSLNERTLCYTRLMYTALVLSFLLALFTLSGALCIHIFKDKRSQGLL